MPRMGLTSDKVVAAAADIADRKGLEGLSLSVLADTLGVRVPSLYKHVSGYDDLLRRLAALSDEALGTMVEAAVRGRRGRDALIAYAAAHRAFALHYPGRFAASRWAAAHTAPGQGRLEGRLERILAGILGQYPAVGEDIRDAVSAVHSSLLGFLWAESSGQIPPSAAETSFGWLLSLLDRGLAEAPPADRRRALAAGFRLPALGNLPGLSGLPGLGRA